jgi:hypothetical protein
MKRWWLLIGVGIISSILVMHSPAPTPQPVSEPSYQPINTQQSPVNNLSNKNIYENSDGETVHSPAYSESIPVGATAQCSDGTYSFSQSRRGTCSHHGGVARWL